MDLSEFLHEDRGPKSKKSDTVGFSKINLKFCLFFPLFGVFRTLRENATLDFAHFAYFVRSYRYLQLFYWNQVLEKSVRPSKMIFFGQKFSFFHFSQKVLLGSARYRILSKYKVFVSICKRPHVREKSGSRVILSAPFFWESKFQKSQKKIFCFFFTNWVVLIPKMQ